MPDPQQPQTVTWPWQNPNIHTWAVGAGAVVLLAAWNAFLGYINSHPIIAPAPTVNIQQPAVVVPDKAAEPKPAVIPAMTAAEFRAMLKEAMQGAK